MRETERPTCSPMITRSGWPSAIMPSAPRTRRCRFAARLARENGWSAAHAARVIEEYKRFCFLAATAGHAVTPSHAVDQAWHLHLTYSRDYWERFCPAVLGRALHHDPTHGGPVERHRHFRQYAETLKSYERAFGQGAPEDFWPRSDKRMIDDPGSPAPPSARPPPKLDLHADRRYLPTCSTPSATGSPASAIGSARRATALVAEAAVRRRRAAAAAAGEGAQAKAGRPLSAV